MSTNINPGEDTKLFVMMVGRHQTMTPTTTKNPDIFLRSVAQSGQYLLAPAHFVSETEIPDIGLGLALLKDQLIVKNAWEVAPNDFDAAAFIDEDDPFIPSGVKDAPVTELLATLRGFAQRRRG